MILLVCAVVSTPFPACGQDARAPIVRVRKIHIRTLDVFDTSHKEFDSWGFRFMNRFHFKTRHSVIRKELLISEGDLYIPDLIKESERNLRRYAFLSDISIKTTRINDSEVDLHISTEDQWTTKVQISFGKTKGNHSYDFGIEEDNFLGLGKEIGIKYENDREREKWNGAYLDPRFLNTRLRFQFKLSDNSDGYSNFVTLTQPFYSQDVDWSYGIHFDTVKRIEHLYSEGEDVVHLNRVQNAGHVFLTRAWGNRYRKLKVGPFFGYDELLYPGEPLILNRELASQPGIQNDLNPVEKRIFNYGLRVEGDRQRYTKFYYLDKFGRTEDLPSGLLAGISIVHSKNSLGADYLGAGLIFRFSAEKNARSYFVTDSEVSFRRQSEDWNNLFANLSARYYLQTPGFRLGYLKALRQTLAFQLGATLTHQMDSPFQLSLGEEEGLRGYAFKEFTGQNRLIFNAEDRIFTNWETRLGGIGFAPFFDAGYVWGERNSDESQFGASVGLGLRLGFKKYGRTKILRVDFAYPLLNMKKRGIAISVISGQLFSVL